MLFGKKKQKKAAQQTAQNQQNGMVQNPQGGFPPPQISQFPPLQQMPPQNFPQGMPQVFPQGQGFPQGQFPPGNPSFPQAQGFPNPQPFPQGQGFPFPTVGIPQVQESPAPPMPGQTQKDARYYRQKKPSPLFRVLSIVMAIGALAFLASYLYNNFVPQGDQYATVQKATYGQSYEGQVLIIRDESVFDDEGVSDIEYEALEGSVIGRTEIVAQIFSSGYSEKERRTLQNYRSQIKLYQNELLSAEATFDQKMDRLVEDVYARAIEVRNVVLGEQGNLLNLEQSLETAINERQNYFREKYAEDQRLSRLYADESTQLKRIESWKKQANANTDGIVSFYTDGYEFGLELNQIDNYNPSYVARLLNGARPDESVSRRGRTDIYRMVKSNNWAALMLIQNSTWNPTAGTPLKLTLQQFSDVTVDTVIYSFARNGNTLLLRLAVNHPVEQVLYTRSSKAIIGQYADALSVPERAIYKQDGSTGVVVLVDSRKVFVPCEVIHTENGIAFLKPQHNNTLYEGQSVLLF